MKAYEKLRDSQVRYHGVRREAVSKTTKENLRHRQNYDEHRKNIQKAYDKIYAKDAIRAIGSMYEWILDLLDLEADQKILDVGCGGGFLLQAAEKRGLIGYGLEISGEAVKQAKKNAPKSEFCMGDAENLPWKDRSFDCVTCLGTLEHLLHSDVGVREIARVLRTDGQACFLLPNTFFIAEIWKVYTTGSTTELGQPIEHFATRKEWEKLIEDNCFSIIKVYKWNPPWPITNFGRLIYRLIRPLIPLNLSYHFAFLCRVMK